MVHHRADAAEFLAAAGAAGTAVDQVRDRGTVAGGAAGVLAVEHEHAAVVGRDPGDQLLGHGGIVGADRGHQRAAAAGGEPDGVGQVRVADHRGHRAEGLERVDSSASGSAQLSRTGDMKAPPSTTPTLPSALVTFGESSVP